MQTQWWTLSLAGHAVGIEERRLADEGNAVLVRRTLRLAADGRKHTIVSTILAQCDRACTVSLWDPSTGTREVLGITALPEVWPPGQSGVADVLDAARARAVPTTVIRVDDKLTWETPSGPAWLHLDAAGVPARFGIGRYEAVRVPVRPALPDHVDPAEVLSLPTPREPRARRALVAEYLVDGVSVRVDVPMAAEIPAETRRVVQAAVRDVARQLDGSFVPGNADAAAVRMSRSGDCTEHAVALVDRLQRDGLQARTAAGRVYVDRGDAGALVLHAWAEVLIGARWVPADAALGQFPADATHLRLGTWVADLLAADGAAISLRSVR